MAKTQIRRKAKEVTMSYPRYEVFKDSKREYRFHLKSKNYEIILTASEGYINKSDCLNAISVCQRNSQYDSDYDKRTTITGKYYFTLRSDNGRDIGRSQDYSTSWGRDEGIKDVKRDAPTKIIVDQTLVSA
jgi:uncharacterized protein YegP (UPF0339 family)